MRPELDSNRFKACFLDGHAAPCPYGLPDLRISFYEVSEFPVIKFQLSTDCSTSAALMPPNPELVVNMVRPPKA